MANFDYFDALLPLLGLAVGGKVGGKLGAATGLAAVSSGMGTVADVRKERQEKQELSTRRKRIQMEKGLSLLGPQAYDKAVDELYGPGTGAEAARRRQAEAATAKRGQIQGRIQTQGPEGAARTEAENFETLQGRPMETEDLFDISRKALRGVQEQTAKTGRINRQNQPKPPKVEKAPKPQPMNRKEILDREPKLRAEYYNRYMEAIEVPGGTREWAYKSEYLDPNTGKVSSDVPDINEFVEFGKVKNDAEYMKQFDPNVEIPKPPWTQETLPKPDMYSRVRGQGRDVYDTGRRSPAATPRIAMQPQAPAAPPIVQPQPSVAAQPDTAVPAMAAKPRIRPEMIGGAQAPAAPPVAPAREQDLARLRALKVKNDTAGLTDAEAQEVMQINGRLSKR